MPRASLAPPLALAACILFTLGSCDPREGSSAASTASSSSRAAGAVEIHKASAATEEVAAVVRRELARAAGSGRRLLVYVGASWCEPCTRFHAAAEAGLLNEAFPGLTLLEFDKDRDGDALKAAGYSSRLIPLFAVPAADGRASGKQMDGSIKGEGAVAEITPRLRKLLEEPR